MAVFKKFIALKAAVITTFRLFAISIYTRKIVMI